MLAKVSALKEFVEREVKTQLALIHGAHATGSRAIFCVTETAALDSRGRDYQGSQVGRKL